MTLILKSNTITAPNSMTPLDMTNILLEAAVLALPGLVAWFRPDYGLSGTGNGSEGSGGSIEWLDMIAQVPLTAMSDTGPQLISSAHNSQPCLRFGATGRNGRMYDDGDNGLWPASADYTLAYVAKDAGGSNTAYIGTNVASPGYAQIQHASSGAVRVQHLNSAGNLFTGSAPGDTNPHIGLMSYDFSDHSFEFRVDAASVATGTAASEVAAGKLTVGTAGASGSPTFRGDFYELLCFNEPYHIAGKESQLAALEAYLTSRYAL
jgi:hypothetical protein